MMQKKVLVVDDEAAIRRQLGVSMAQLGFEVHECPDALSALQAIEQHARQGRPFAYVVADLVLPDIDGLKLLNVIKSRYPDLKVIVISGYGNEKTEEEVKLHNGDAYLQKPFDTEELIKVLNQMPVEQKDEVSEEKTPETCASAYLFARISRDADPLETYNKLAYEDGVLYCDAVRDSRWDLVLLLHGRTEEEVRKKAVKLVGNTEGISDYEVVPVARPYLPPEVQGFIDDYNRANAGKETFFRMRKRATSYVIVDVAPQHMANLYVRLYFLDEVVEIDASKRCDRFILLVQGPDFAAIRKTINQKIRVFDGVLRVHELKVVALNEM